MQKILILLALSISLEGPAQILDDSTELVYGPETTKYILEKQVLNNQINYSTVDTSLYLFERQSIVDRNERKYQNLGNFGTALFPVFYNHPNVIGRTSGFNAFSVYSGNSRNIRYYDTKSPFIDLFVYLGGGNRNLVNIGFSRNVREGWNVGFDLHKITTDKQLANNGQGDRQLVGTTFDIYTHYKSQKTPYQVLFYHSNQSHKAIELGGVRFGNDSTLAELFQFNNALLRLDEAQNIRKESNWHLYHNYQIAEQFQLYHVADHYKEENTYQDFAGGLVFPNYDTYRDAYNTFLIDPDSTYERATFSSFSSEAGIKGDLSSVFYRAYVKLRTVDFSYFLLNPVKKTTEKYLGGYAQFNWKKKYQLIGEGEFLQGGEYQFAGKLKSDLIKITYSTKKYNVPFIYGAYFGNHYEWNNNFSPVFNNRIYGNIQLTYKAFTFIPEATFTAYNDFVFFNESKTPSQASSGILTSTIGGKINVTLPNKKGESFHFEHEILVTNVSGGSAGTIRIPRLFYNGRYYWRGEFFDDNVPVEIGIDSHARSAYFANAYDPVTQQFYLQNELQTFGYYKADFFLNMRLDKFYAAIKWTHFDQPSDIGYFVTPYYPGQPKSIDLIVRWTFFN